MSKYVRGYYKAEANKIMFDELLDLKHDIQYLAGLEQNDMIITEVQMDECEAVLNKLVSTLQNWFESKFYELEYLGVNLPEEEK